MNDHRATTRKELGDKEAFPLNRATAVNDMYEVSSWGCTLWTSRGWRFKAPYRDTEKPCVNCKEGPPPLSIPLYSVSGSIPRCIRSWLSC